MYHGLPENLLKPIPNVKPGYLAFLGRISPEKRVDRAIWIAGATGMKIKIAAKIDNADRPYYEEQIKPLFALPHVEYIGEINEQQKIEFLGNAHALLFPIDWPEPFGLVMIEAMACDMHVIAFNRGSVPEVIENGVSGFVVEDELSAIVAVKRLDTLPRAKVRQAFETRFSSKVMAARVHTYEELLRAKRRTVLRSQRELIFRFDDALLSAA